MVEAAVNWQEIEGTCDSSYTSHMQINDGLFLLRVKACTHIQLVTDGTRHTVHPFVLCIWNMDHTTPLPEAKTVNYIERHASMEELMLLCTIVFRSANSLFAGRCFMNQSLE